MQLQLDCRNDPRAQRLAGERLPDRQGGIAEIVDRLALRLMHEDHVELPRIVCAAHERAPAELACQFPYLLWMHPSDGHVGQLSPQIAHGLGVLRCSHDRHQRGFACDPAVRQDKAMTGVGLRDERLADTRERRNASVLHELRSERPLVVEVEHDIVAIARQLVVLRALALLHRHVSYPWNPGLQPAEEARIDQELPFLAFAPANTTL